MGVKSRGIKVMHWCNADQKNKNLVWTKVTAPVIYNPRLRLFIKAATVSNCTSAPPPPCLPLQQLKKGQELNQTQQINPKWNCALKHESGIKLDS